MTEKLVNEFKQEIDGLTLIPSDGGRFEVTLNGDLVYSKLKTGSFPEESDIEKEVRKRL